MYADDIFVTGDDLVELEALKKYPATKFELKDHGALRYFLSMEVARSKARISISQRKYVLDFTCRYRDVRLQTCRDTHGTKPVVECRRRKRSQARTISKGWWES